MHRLYIKLSEIIKFYAIEMTLWLFISLACLLWALCVKAAVLLNAEGKPWFLPWEMVEQFCQQTERSLSAHMACGDLNGDGLQDALIRGMRTSEGLWAWPLGQLGLDQMLALGGHDGLGQIDTLPWPHDYAGLCWDLACANVWLRDSDGDKRDEIIRISRLSGQASQILARQQDATYHIVREFDGPEPNEVMGGELYVEDYDQDGSREGIWLNAQGVAKVLWGEGRVDQILEAFWEFYQYHLDEQNAKSHHSTSTTTIQNPSNKEPSYKTPENTAHTHDASAESIGIMQGASAPLPARANLAGRLEAKTWIDEQGGSRYAIPVRLGAGAPSWWPGVSLEYNSHGGNGVAGLGMGLKAASMITRCRETFEQDGQESSYWPYKRFCMDGKRLILIRGEYGANGSEYRLEFDEGLRIVAYGKNIWIGPEWFRVSSKDGVVWDYGVTPDSKQMWSNGYLSGVWAVSQATDAMGQIVRFRYGQEQNAWRELWLDSIEYGGNQKLGIPTSGRVVFRYEARPDRQFSYAVNTQLGQTRRLTAIDVIEGSTMIRGYRLGYELIPSGHSAVAWIQECGVGDVCLPATQLTWLKGSSGFSGGQHQLGPKEAGDSTKARFVDVNGDGRDDLVTREGGRIIVYFSQGDSLGSRLDTGVGESDWAQWTNIDGEAGQDLVIPQGGRWWWYRYDLKTQRFIGRAMNLPVIGNDLELSRWRWLDVNGDGLMDGVWFRQVGLWQTREEWYRNVRGSFAGAQALTIAWDSNEHDGVEWMQGMMQWAVPSSINADGATDMVMRVKFRKQGGSIPDRTNHNKAGGERPQQWIETLVFVGDGHSGYVEHADFGAVSPLDVRWVDINGDGLGDNVYQAEGKGMYYRINTAGSFGPARYELSDITSGDSVLWVDANQDHRMDIVYPQRGRWWIRYAGVEGFGAAVRLPITVAEVPLKTLRAADLNGDGHMDLIGPRQGSWWIWWSTNKAKVRNVVARVVDGFGQEVMWQYGVLTDPSIYSADSDAAQHKWGRGSPVYDIRGPYTVVRAVGRTVSPMIQPGQIEIGRLTWSSYAYYGGKVQSGGRGFLGFRTIRVWEVGSGRMILTTRRQDMPFIGKLREELVQWSTTRLNTSTLPDTLTAWESSYEDAEKNADAVEELPEPLSTLVMRRYRCDWVQVVPHGNVRYVYPNRCVRTEYDDKGKFQREITTDLVYQSGDDAFYGNLTQQTEHVRDALEQWQQRTEHHRYENRVSADLWQIGLLRDKTTTWTRGDAVAESMTERWDYDGMALWNTHETDVGTPFAMLDQVKRDGWGHVVQRTRSIQGGEQRSESYRYDPSGRFVLERTDSLGQIEQWNYDAIGNPVNYRDKRGLIAQYAYDALGRKVEERLPEGVSSRLSYQRCSVAACATVGAVFLVRKQQVGHPLQVSWYDRLGRLVRISGQRVDGRTFNEDKGYDVLGHVRFHSRPYYDGEAAYYTTTDYDRLDRVVRETDAKGAIKRFEYVGLQTDAYDALNYRTRSLRNGQGELVSMTDALNQTTHWVYGARGQLLAVRNALGLQTSFAYDAAGRRIEENDLNRGRTQYRYSAFGDLQEERDALGRITRYRYDVMGQILEREVRDTDNKLSEQAQFTWQQGRLIQESETQQNIQKNYQYDDKGHLTSHNLILDGKTYSERYAYDAYGRLASMRDETGLGVKYIYNAYGYRSALHDLVTNEPYETLVAQTADGQMIERRLGHGLVEKRDYELERGLLSGISFDAQALDLRYQYDANRRVLARQHRVDTHTWQETFNYDPLHRLVKISGTPSMNQWSYDAQGNLTEQQNLGRYRYGSTQGVHAVQAIDGEKPNQLSYDARGNMVADSARKFQYNGFDRVQHIEQPATGASLDLRYSSSRDLIEMRESLPTKTTGSSIDQTVEGSQAAVRKTIYHGASERVYWQGQRYIRRLVSDAVQLIRTPTGIVPIYLYRDAQGSVLSVLDANARILESRHYTPFGARAWSTTLPIQASTRAIAPPLAKSQASEATKIKVTSTLPVPWTEFGFTGQREWSAFGVIAFPGRIYDPQIARMLQADPMMQNDLPQSWNRYSYVENNPLNRADPLGYFSLGELFDILKPALAIVLSIWTGGATATWAAATLGVNSVVAGVIGGAIGGFVGGAIAAGNLHGALVGAFTGAVLGGIDGAFGSRWSFQRVMTQSVASGAVAEVTGYQFKDGFRIAFALGMIRWGWEYTRVQTDTLKLKACQQPGATACAFNKWGEPLTDGVRDQKPGLDQNGRPYPQRDNLITSIGMEQEGSGKHWYDENSYLGRFINNISKTHDWMNSWGYDHNTGYWISKSLGYNTMFQLYSFSGMLPAAIYTSAAISASAPLPLWREEYWH